MGGVENNYFVSFGLSLIGILVGIMIVSARGLTSVFIVQKCGVLVIRAPVKMGY